MLLLELECGDAVVDALLKGSAHKVPKLALACVEALRISVKGIGTPAVVPPKPILEGNRAPVRLQGRQGSRRGEGSHRGAHQVARPRCRAQGSDREDGGHHAGGGASRRGSHRDWPRGSSTAHAQGAGQPAAGHGWRRRHGRGRRRRRGGRRDGRRPETPDAYELADPESILDKLEKQPKDKETPKFWDAVNSAKWKERLDAVTRLKELADAPRLASGDYGDVARALKKIVTKDANIACVGEACAAAGALAKGLRKEWTREAKVLLPGMLDKLKDKNSSVVQKNQDALLEFSKHCFSLADVADDILAALAHKMPKVPQQTLLWIATAAREMKTNTTATHAQRALLPGVLKCIDAANPDVRAAAIDAIGAGARGRGVANPWPGRSTSSTTPRRRRSRRCARRGDGREGRRDRRRFERETPTSRANPPRRSPRPKPRRLEAGSPGPLARPSAAAPKRSGAAAGVVGSSSEADADVAEGAPASKEELVERASRLYAADVVAKLQSSNWKSGSRASPPWRRRSTRCRTRTRAPPRAIPSARSPSSPALTTKFSRFSRRCSRFLDPSRPRRPSSRNTTGPSRCRDSRRKSRT